MRTRGRFEQELADLEVPSRAPITVTHFHVRKAIDPSIRALMPDPSPGAMTPARMAPGYVLPSDARRRQLQDALDALLRASYADGLAPPVHLRVGLVDLTGVRYHAPVFAGHWAWGGSAALEAGSLAKILPLYALYQLRFDLDTTAAQQGITTGKALLAFMKAEWKRQGLVDAPDVPALFTFAGRSGDPVVARLRQVHDVHHNHVARNLIVMLGFPYIGSVALQSGLFDPAHGGLWLNAAYNEPALTWTTSPFPKQHRHNATALATATYFTLLAQGRLVNEATSAEIRKVLGMRLCMGNGPLDGIRGLGGAVNPVANKCGLLKPFYHEGCHVIRRASGGRTLSYALAMLTKRPPNLDLKELGRNIDALVDAANP
ncbi:hypothetical protein TBR22_A06510 [Luteitalea sp. TBR-22]|uniref:hypothetical protein n=1 Tax=Luteitalea sp. TBR-22 TaxID=2802971 RepID=UPI001AF878CF|nr:hypothetical protein [Luteitalea sp. TBR-22]BCS31450.1 hypothetical protein TBR22_A06510 [Luteitalea sp. TBR-22]